jgi:hypothetical protein
MGGFESKHHLCVEYKTKNSGPITQVFEREDDYQLTRILDGMKHMGETVIRADIHKYVRRADEFPSCPVCAQFRTQKVSSFCAIAANNGEDDDGEDDDSEDDDDEDVYSDKE